MTTKNDNTLTKKELLSYFDIPETIEERDAMRTFFYDPPQNEEELRKVKILVY